LAASVSSRLTPLFGFIAIRASSTTVGHKIIISGLKQQPRFKISGRDFRLARHLRGRSAIIEYMQSSPLTHTAGSKFLSGASPGTKLNSFELSNSDLFHCSKDSHRRRKPTMAIPAPLTCARRSEYRSATKPIPSPIPIRCKIPVASTKANPNSSPEASTGISAPWACP
jgi:hypothetical protein